MGMGNSIRVDSQTKKKHVAKKQAHKQIEKKKVVVNLSDDKEEDADDSPSNFRWTDPKVIEEVIELIAFHQEMDDDFKKNAKKLDYDVLIEWFFSAVLSSPMI